MDASEVITLLGRDDSVKSYRYECIDLLEPTEEEAMPKSKVNK